MTKQIRAAIPEAWALMDREATLDNTRSAVWAILAHLEGMEAVTNSQPVAQETTTDAPACEHEQQAWVTMSVRWCPNCGALQVADGWALPRLMVPAGSA